MAATRTRHHDTGGGGGGGGGDGPKGPQSGCYWHYAVDSESAVQPAIRFCQLVAMRRGPRVECWRFGSARHAGLMRDSSVASRLDSRSEAAGPSSARSAAPRRPTQSCAARRGAQRSGVYDGISISADSSSRIASSVTAPGMRHLYFVAVRLTHWNNVSSLTRPAALLVCPLTGHSLTVRPRKLFSHAHISQVHTVHHSRE